MVMIHLYGLLKLATKLSGFLRTRHSWSSARKAYSHKIGSKVRKQRPDHSRSEIAKWKPLHLVGFRIALQIDGSNKTIACNLQSIFRTSWIVQIQKYA
jgi:hypothetical protein